MRVSFTARTRAHTRTPPAFILVSERHALAHARLCSIGTTKKGIGPAYSAKASRSGLRVHHLFNHDTFADKFRKIVEGRYKRYGHFEYDTEGEIQRYKVRAPPPALGGRVDADMVVGGRRSGSGCGRTWWTASCTCTRRSRQGRGCWWRAPTR